MRLWPFVFLAVAACDGRIVGGTLPAKPVVVTPDPVVITDPPDVPEPEVLPDFQAAPLRPRLLTSAQYMNSLKMLLGEASLNGVVPPIDVSINGLVNIAASQTSLSTSAVELYEKNAMLAAAAAMANPTQRARLVTCTPTTFNDLACMQLVAANFGLHAFRRPLNQTEAQRWPLLGVTVANTYSDFNQGVTFMLAGMIQSAGFLYLDETGVSDGHPSRKIDAYALAGRLAFFLTQSPPDDELLAAAADGSLLTDEVLKAHAERLLSRPQARAAIVSELEEILELHHVELISKDHSVFPEFDSSLAASMRNSERLFLEWLTFGKRDFRELFTTQTIFTDTRMAPIFGVMPPFAGWAGMQMPANQPRRGLLGHPAFLAQQSHASGNSITYRGKFIREKLLCTGIDAPPPDVNTALPEPVQGQAATLRQRVEQHMNQTRCSGCHKMMDPLGFPLESFDALGRYRTTDNGAMIDPSGSLDGVAFTDAAGLGQALANDPRVMRCLTRSMYRQASGHVDEANELKPLVGVVETFKGSGYRFESLLVSMVLSDAFRNGRSMEGAP